MMNSFQANDSLILLKLVVTDTIDRIVFIMIIMMDSMLVLCAIVLMVFSSPKNQSYTIIVLIDDVLQYVHCTHYNAVNLSF